MGAARGPEQRAHGRGVARVGVAAAPACAAGASLTPCLGRSSLRTCMGGLAQRASPGDSGQACQGSPPLASLLGCLELDALGCRCSQWDETSLMKQVDWAGANRSVAHPTRAYKVHRVTRAVPNYPVCRGGAQRGRGAAWHQTGAQPSTPPQGRGKPAADGGTEAGPSMHGEDTHFKPRLAGPQHGRAPAACRRGARGAPVGRPDHHRAAGGRAEPAGHGGEARAVLAGPLGPLEPDAVHLVRVAHKVGRLRRQPQSRSPAAGQRRRCEARPHVFFRLRSCVPPLARPGGRRQHLARGGAGAGPRQVGRGSAARRVQIGGACSRGYRRSHL